MPITAYTAAIVTTLLSVLTILALASGFGVDVTQALVRTLPLVAVAATSVALAAHIIEGEPA